MKRERKRRLIGNWADLANCKSATPEEQLLVFSEADADIFINKFCDTCYVKTECGNDAKANAFTDGVWGGQFIPQLPATKRTTFGYEIGRMLEWMMKRAKDRVWIGELDSLAKVSGVDLMDLDQCLHDLEAGKRIKLVPTSREKLVIYELLPPKSQNQIEYNIDTTRVMDCLESDSHTNVWIGNSQQAAVEFEWTTSKLAKRLELMRVKKILKSLNTPKSSPNMYQIVPDDLPDNIQELMEVCSERWWGDEKKIKISTSKKQQKTAR